MTGGLRAARFICALSFIMSPMRMFANLFALVTAVLVLLAAAWAVALGMAGEQFQTSAQKMWSLRKQSSVTGKRPSAAELSTLEQETAEAIALAPDHGQLRLTQFLIASTSRQMPDGAVIENDALALEAIQAALVRLPHSPVMWAEYALVADRRHSEGRLPGGAARLSHIIQRALTLGPREPNMMLGMLDLGLRNWDELDPGARGTLEQAVSRLNAARRNVAMDIAFRRGRVTELCGMAPMRSHRVCIQAAGAAKAAEAAAAQSADADVAPNATATPR